MNSLSAIIYSNAIKNIGKKIVEYIFMMWMTSSVCLKMLDLPFNNQKFYVLFLTNFFVS